MLMFLNVLMNFVQDVMTMIIKIESDFVLNASKVIMLMMTILDVTFAEMELFKQMKNVMMEIKVTTMIV